MNITQPPKSVTDSKPSLIVNTFRKPKELACVLDAIACGTSLPHEVILAEDDTNPETLAVAEHFHTRLNCPLLHCTQVNEGYRRARILNQAITRSTGDYLIFLDGDCIPFPRFIEDHCALAAAGYFVQARRAYLKETAVRDFLSGKLSLFAALLRGQVSGAIKLLRLPYPRIREDQQLEKILGCNLGIWKQDLVTVNGFDESFVGWGIEDSDLAARLYHAGIRRRFVYGRAVLLHLNHPNLPRDRYEANRKRLDECLAERRIRCELGLD